MGCGASTPTSTILSDSPMLKQYQRCEELIVKKVQRMINIIESNKSINYIDEQIDPEIIKECYPWVKHMNFAFWSEFGYDDNGKDIGVQKSIREYIKKYGYTDEYNMSYSNIIFHTKTNTNVSVEYNFFKQQKFINPFFKHLSKVVYKIQSECEHDGIYYIKKNSDIYDFGNRPFMIEIYKKEKEYMVKMYRSAKFSINTPIYHPVL